jgi:hypothetical protein
MDATPLAVARNQAAARERANLEAALAALDAVDLVTVQSARNMGPSLLRQHISLRHPGLTADFRSHAIDHVTMNGLDHIHEEPT